MPQPRRIERSLLGQREARDAYMTKHHVFVTLVSQTEDHDSLLAARIISSPTCRCEARKTNQEIFVVYVDITKPKTKIFLKKKSSKLL